MQLLVQEITRPKWKEAHGAHTDWLSILSLTNSCLIALPEKVAENLNLELGYVKVREHQLIQNKERKATLGITSLHNVAWTNISCWLSEMIEMKC